MASTTDDTGSEFTPAAPVFFRAQEIREFWDHMLSISESDGLPAVNGLELMDIHKLAPMISLLDVEEPACRLRVRFVGTWVVAMFGRETTGMYLDEVDLGEYQSELLQVYRTAVDTRAAQWTIAKVRLTDINLPLDPNNQHFVYERLVFPLADQDGAVSRLVALLTELKGQEQNVGFEAQSIDLGTWRSVT